MNVSKDACRNPNVCFDPDFTVKKNTFFKPDVLTNGMRSLRGVVVPLCIPGLVSSIPDIISVFRCALNRTVNHMIISAFVY